MVTLDSKTLIIASTNRGKVTEVIAYFKELPLTLLTLENITLPQHLQEVEETGTTFAANARIKAETIGSFTHSLTLADDSGLEIDALDGRPGVYSRRYGNSDTDRIQKILAELNSVPESLRTARFVCVIALFEPEGEKGTITEFTGSVEGFITTKTQGVGGFGYDPIFFCPELNQTFAESSQAEKNSVSHRGRALSKVKSYLKTKFGS